MKHRPAAMMMKTTMLPSVIMNDEASNHGEDCYHYEVRDNLGLNVGR